MAHAFVGESQPMRIDRGALVEHERIVEIGAQSETFPPKSLRVTQESKTTGARQVGPECFGRQLEGLALAANRRWKGDFHIESEAGFRRAKLRPPGAVRYAHRLYNAQRTPRRRKRDDACFVDRRNEVASGSVHRRNFIAVEHNERIVDAKRCKRSHQMFDCRHAGAIAREPRAQFRCVDAGPMRFDFRSCNAENNPDASAAWRER
jgi:hypothetical protein